LFPSRKAGVPFVFFHDFEWYVELSENTVGEAKEPTRCDECHDTIPAGGWVRHIFQQEHEMCQRCEEGDEPECEGGKHDYGETYAYDRCQGCDKVLRAIEQAEIEEGCKGDETQPALEGLREALSEDPEAMERYRRKLQEMFPEAVGHATSKLGMVVDEESDF
jgi:hypothetical protein